MIAAPNVDAVELSKFDALAHQYWDAHGPLHTLHSLNVPRTAYVAGRAPLAGATLADIGCGGGLLAESLARLGARVTAIDLSAAMIEVAQLHLAESAQLQAPALTIDYRLISVAELARTAPAQFDVVCCMELAEHVPDPGALLQDLARLLRPGGALFISTINRNLRSFLGAIVAAEYLLKLLPRGTHEYARLIRPAELARAARSAGLELRDVQGLDYDPLMRQSRLAARPDINYIAHFVLPAGAAVSA
ncbi:MAG: bifunctional 2-polyprenyl-6-hydroxyphenol methylase/3-demethylubiquinol 3-O-methyltransferase UbiG [Steroidobacteraceae bacterium]